MSLTNIEDDDDNDNDEADDNDDDEDKSDEDDDELKVDDIVGNGGRRGDAISNPPFLA